MKNKYMDMLREEANLEEDEQEEEISEENLLPYDEEKSQHATEELVTVMRRTILLLSGLEAVITVCFVYGFPNNWTHGKWQALLGLLIGTAYAVLWLYSLKWQMESLVMPETTHQKGKLKLGSVARILLLALICAAALVTKVFNPILVIIGAFNLKLAGLLYPLCKRFLSGKEQHELQS